MTGDFFCEEVLGGVFERFLLEFLGGVSDLFAGEDASEGESTLSTGEALLVGVSDLFIAEDLRGDHDLFCSEDPSTVSMTLVSSSLKSNMM